MEWKECNHCAILKCPVVETVAARAQISRVSDVVQTKPLKDCWEHKSMTKYVLETEKVKFVHISRRFP